MDVFLISFGIVFVSMLILVGIQVMRQDELPTGCTPEGCKRCRKDCPTKAAFDAQADGGESRG